MGGGGFEPPKQNAADLQSVPFGHSGIHPCDAENINSIFISHKKLIEKHFIRRLLFLVSYHNSRGGRHNKLNFS